MFFESFTKWWNVLGDWLIYHIDVKTIFFIFNIGVALLLLAIFLPSKISLYKIDLKKMLNRKVTDVPMSKEVKYLHGITKKGLFRHIKIDEESEEYRRIEDKIIKAGGLKGLTPDIVHFMKVMLPILMFSILTVIYLFSLNTGLSSNTSSIFKNNSGSGIIIVQQDKIPNFNIGIIFTIATLSIPMYFIPEYMINLYGKQRSRRLKDELLTIEMFISIYLDAGYNVYDVLKALSDVVVYSKKYITECINEYYIAPEKAVQNMADKIGIPEYQLVCDILKQSISTSNAFAASFVKQHMEQLNKLKDLAYQAKIKKRPVLYVFVLALPFLNIILIWFYPWVVKVMEVSKFIG